LKYKPQLTLRVQIKWKRILINHVTACSASFKR
jgi:hypothetical protein